MNRTFNLIARLVLPSLGLAHATLFLAFWLTNRLFYSSTNDYLAKMLGKRLDYVSLCLLFAGLVTVWSAARLFFYRSKKTHRLAVLATWLYSLLTLFFIAFFYGSFWILLKESPVQLPRLAQMLLYFRVILDPLLLLCVSLLAGLWVRHNLIQRKSAGRPVASLPITLLLLGFAVLWVLPLVFPPESVIRETLPGKPLVIAHRGAAMLAPENTLASANLAVDLGVDGLETDIHISRDGLPFLMHDDTFVRTTNVKVVFPGREKERVEYFTLAEALQLNAGQWFVEQDPYQTITRGQVSAGQLDEYHRQTVPPLAQELQIVRQKKLIFIFDLKQPPDDQPYAISFFDICLSQIQTAGIDPQVWFNVDTAQLAVLRQVAPAMKPAYFIDYRTPPPAVGSKEAGYQIINSEYGLSKSWIRQYQAAGLWINLYTIDEPWQFSRLWLLGVGSTTTTNPQAMIALRQPVLSLSFTRFLVLWNLFGIVVLAGLLGLILPVFQSHPYSFHCL